MQNLNILNEIKIDSKMQIPSSSKIKRDLIVPNQSMIKPSPFKKEVRKANRFYT
jgi:hypothetical protein